MPVWWCRFKSVYPCCFCWPLGFWSVWPPKGSSHKPLMGDHVSKDRTKCQPKKAWILSNGLKADGKAAVANGTNRFHRHNCKQWETSFAFSNKLEWWMALPISCCKEVSSYNLGDLLFSSFLHVHLVRKLDAAGSSLNVLTRARSICVQLMRMSGCIQQNLTSCMSSASLFVSVWWKCQEESRKRWCQFCKEDLWQLQLSINQVWDHKGRNNIKYWTHLTRRHHSQYD